MVQALDEARRVLVPHGNLIDLRPYCVEAPLEVVFDGSVEPAGLGDTSSSRPDDLAADRAVDTVSGRGGLYKLKTEYFDCAYYWNSDKELLADLEGKWKDDVVIPADILKRASALLRKHHPHARLRLWIRVKLVVYEKQ